MIDEQSPVHSVQVRKTLVVVLCLVGTSRYLCVLVFACGRIDSQIDVNSCHEKTRLQALIYGR